MGFLLLHSGQASAKKLLKRLNDCTGVKNLEPVASQDVVIRWGNTLGNDDDGRVLNPRIAIENTRDRRFMLRMLQLNGVRTPLRDMDTERGEFERRLRVSRYYRVPVFNMQVLTCFRSDKKSVWINQDISKINHHFREVPIDEDKYTTRITRLAVRAIHSLGLDFGLVSLAVSSRGFCYVLDVNPAPVLKGKLLELYVDAFNEWIATEQSSPVECRDFKMGADLEFMLRSNQGKLVLASRFLPRNGEVGYDDVSINRDGRRHPVAELRPVPASEPLQLFENLRTTLLQAKRMIPRPTLEWMAGSMPFPNFPIGGHIHFSSLPLSSRLIKALDTYLGFPVMMIESESTALKRRPKYGFLGDIRLKAHGGFEYRTPGSWIVSPEIAQAVLCLAYLVAVHHRELKMTPFIHLENQKDFYMCDKWALQSLFVDIWKTIENTSTYKLYEEKLKIIPEMVHANMSWNENGDIKKRWGIEYKKKNTSKKKSAAGLNA
jgi:hypothetical protein